MTEQLTDHLCSSGGLITSGIHMLLRRVTRKTVLTSSASVLKKLLLSLVFLVLECK